jgi:hypothetical protein
VEREARARPLELAAEGLKKEKQMAKLYELFAKSVAGVALIVAALLLSSVVMAFPLKWAWNGSVHGLFGWKEIGYWEAFALLWVAGLLVKASPVKS